MAALITITDIEAALGEDISVDDEPRIQYYINVVSSYIEGYTGVSFSLQEDAVIRAVADGRGIIEIDEIVEITEVAQLDPSVGTYGGISVGFPGYYFDGIDKIYGLDPYETYRITLTYGHTSIPTEIKGVATKLVLAGTDLDTVATGGLRSYRVGDVEESYGVSILAGVPVVTLDTLMTKILHSYATGTTTYRT